MKLFLAILIIFTLVGNSNAAQNEAVLIGHFSNLKVTEDEDPHTVAGYSVSLYRQDKTLFGNMAAATGSLEPAQGRLYDIEFSPATGQLRFKAKYSSGWEYSKQTGPDGRQSRQLMNFSGKLTRSSLVGRVVLKDGYQLGNAGKATLVSMKKTKDDYKPKSLEEWTTYSYLDLNPKW